MSMESSRESSVAEAGTGRPEKRRRIEAPAGIGRFFLKTDSTGEHDEDFGAQQPGADSILAEGDDADAYESEKAAALSLPTQSENEATRAHDGHLPNSPLNVQQRSITNYVCSRCSQALRSAEDFEEHGDWHMASDLQDEDRARIQPRPSTTVSNKKPTGNSGKKKASRGKAEKGQSKLAFG